MSRLGFSLRRGQLPIPFNKKAGHYEIESYGNQYIKVVNVRPVK
jgi:hypothetical protein